VAFIVLLMVLLGAGVDVVPFNSDVPLYLRDHITYERSDTKIEGEDVADWFIGADDDQVERTIDKVELQLLWVARDGQTVLTEERLQHIDGVENDVKGVRRFADPDDGFCTRALVVDGDNNTVAACIRRDSVINYMNESFINPGNLSLSLYNDPLVQVVPDLSQANIDRIASAWAAFNVSGVFAPIWEVVDSGFGVPVGNDQAVAARTVFHFGLPIDGYESALEKTDEQVDELTEWLFDAYEDKLSSSGGVGMRLYYSDNEGRMSALKAEEDLITSLLLIVFSVIFVGSTSAS